ncbi:LysR family transcriptional regulator [Afipia sp. GAS231]|uniref:LysR family transcriptional regulator n=1 Tax=Afipia sp. GAS231 TaxID=1882747 RepID=UPI001FCD5124|nr:LysR family transcriptional regulator [Afipia sp. GAS231]
MRLIGMHGRPEHLIVPLEIVRTVLAISETGSLSRAGKRLGLSQTAVSAQLKRIQNLLGGEIFRKTPNGTAPTPLGKMVLNQGRRMLEANDQMLRLGGTDKGPQPIRFGISTLFVEEFLEHETAETLAGIVMYTEDSLGIAKGLIDGYIDIACMLDSSEAGAEVSNLVVREREEPFVWVRSKDFVLSPGAPIPLLTWPGDDMMVRALTKKGSTYTIVFNSPDYHATVRALETGIGLAALPKRTIPPSLVEAKEYYLPALRPVKTLLCARRDLETPQANKLLRRLSELLFTPG